MTDQFSDVQTSYGRCLRQRDFTARFYEIFLESNPQIPAVFSHTDFTKQNKALRRGISAAIEFAAGSSIVRRTVEQMAQVHSRNGRAPVSPHLYDHWVESMIQTVSESDPNASPALLRRWRQALTPVVEHFRSSY